MAKANKRVQSNTGVRVYFNCDTCGNEHFRKQSQFDLYDRHYCSNACRANRSRINKPKYNRVTIKKNIELMFIAGLSDEEIAKKIGVLPKTVNKRRKNFILFKGKTKGHIRINPFKIKYYDGEDEERSILEAIIAPDKEYKPEDLEGWERITYERLIKNEKTN